MDLRPTLQQDDDWFAVGSDERDYLHGLDHVDDDADGDADVMEDGR